MTDTPYLGTRYCPRCEPDRDPTAEILDVVYCSIHMVQNESEFVANTGEAGGNDNILWCAFFHRNRKQEAPKTVEQP